MLTSVRTESAKARGQYYTPPDITDLMARMALDVPKPGASINDPACGTGGMSRAADAWMIGAGIDPGNVRWEGNDLDHVAVACCAINAVLWGLGTNVLLGVGDTLAADWRKRAIAERDEPIILMRQVTALRSYRDIEADLDDAAGPSRRGGGRRGPAVNEQLLDLELAPPAAVHLVTWGLGVESTAYLVEVLDLASEHATTIVPPARSRSESPTSRRFRARSSTRSSTPCAGPDPQGERVRSHGEPGC
ncbi:N-6 DNA methylase [Amycolatopsis sp. NPDC051758]|uniref:N-6 DNA methylase n=1 Tax=Amycolatopsis sp. NPDC051758 TaxID=3363935 RepID=UPI00378ABF35